MNLAPLTAVLKDLRFWAVAAAVVVLGLVVLAAGHGTFVWGDVQIDLGGPDAAKLQACAEALEACRGRSGRCEESNRVLIDAFAAAR